MLDIPKHALMVVLVALFLLIAGYFGLSSLFLAAVEATLQSLKSLGLMISPMEPGILEY